MSRFYASVQGNKSVATRQGTINSGIQGHIRGWNSGVKITGYTNGNDEDCFAVYQTSGSVGGSSDVLIGIIENSKFAFVENK